MLKWVFERVNGDAEAVETPIGLLPTPDALDTDGLEIADDDLAELLAVDTAGWRDAVPADPRALRPVRSGPPGRARPRPRHARRPPVLIRVGRPEPARGVRETPDCENQDCRHHRATREMGGRRGRPRGTSPGRTAPQDGGIRPLPLRRSRRHRRHPGRDLPVRRRPRGLPASSSRSARTRPASRSATTSCSRSCPGAVAAAGARAGCRTCAISAPTLLTGCRADGSLPDVARRCSRSGRCAASRRSPSTPSVAWRRR